MTMQKTFFSTSFLICVLLLTGCQQEAQQDQIAATTAENAPQDFVSVFNGENLDGWVGNTEGYGVQEGNLVCLKDGGGNLYIDKKYSDFELQFEFKLEAGGNNGLGIRAEQGKDAAYYGMELQILDDTADEYAVSSRIWSSMP